MGIYGATKGAVASFTYAWAAEVAGSGVRVNAISPIGLTRMSEANDRYRAQKGLPVYLRTPAPAEANVPVACFLLSDEASRINGQVVRIEGRLLSLMTHPAVLVPVLERDEWTFEAVCEAFRSNLAQRQLPTGVVGLRAEVDLSVARAKRVAAKPPG